MIHPDVGQRISPKKVTKGKKLQRRNDGIFHSIANKQKVKFELWHLCLYAIIWNEKGDAGYLTVLLDYESTLCVVIVEDTKPMSYLDKSQKVMTGWYLTFNSEYKSSLAAKGSVCQVVRGSKKLQLF